MDTLDTDVLVLGSGLAGLTAALAARESGRKVLMVSEARVAAATLQSGGNFRAPVADYPREQLYLETVTASGYLSQRSLAKALAEDAPLIRDLLERAAVKVRDTSRGFRVEAEGEAPGAVLGRALARAAQSAGVRQVEGMGWEVVLGADGRVRGVLAYDAARVGWLAISAGAVIIATGGAAGAYLETDNSAEAVGDGLAMAFRAGAVLADMEFVQFWPLASAASTPRNPLREDVLTGKRLIAGGDRDITERVGLPALAAGTADPAEAARLIYQEAMAGVTGPAEGFRLELRGGGETLPVTPVAHHTMGGVVGGDCGQTRVPGLFVAGEAATGMHGASRLSGSGLSEAAVMGRRAGRLAAEMAAEPAAAAGSVADFEHLARSQIRRTMGLLEGGVPGGVRPSEAIHRIRQTMWESAALVRTRDSLDAAQSVFNRLKRAIPFALDPAVGEEVRAALKALNLLLVAEAIVRSARYRRESRGVHFRADYPARDDTEGLRHIRVRLLQGEMSLDPSQGLELMEP